MRFISERACISALRLVIPRRRLLSSDHCRGKITTDIFNPLPFRAHILRRRVIKPRFTAGSTCRRNYHVENRGERSFFFKKKREKFSLVKRLARDFKSGRGRPRLPHSEKIRMSFVLFSAYLSRSFPQVFLNF